ncbi:MAG: glycosyltransferase family 4 protein, partial [Spongiibacteraceae bacterium]
MKTVLMLHYGDNGIRGSEVCFIESVKALRDAGFRTIVVRNQPAMDKFIQANAFAIETLQYPELMLDGIQSQLPILRYVESLFGLRKMISRWQPDIIYANSGLPCQLAVPMGRAAKVPVLCHFHHPAIKRAYYLWLVKFADAVFFPSQYTRDHSMHKAGVDGRVVHNGVDTQVFKPLAVRDSALRSRLGLSADSIVVGQVGALVPHKRPQLLLKTFASIASEVPQLHLCLVGKGPLENELREQVAALGL